jgi:hypothetical protein
LPSFGFDFFRKMKSSVVTWGLSEEGMKLLNNGAKTLVLLGVVGLTSFALAGWVCSADVTPAGTVTQYAPDPCIDDEPASLPECGDGPIDPDSGVWCKVDPATQEINLYELDDDVCKHIGTDDVPFGVLHTAGTCCEGDE